MPHALDCIGTGQLYSTRQGCVAHLYSSTQSSRNALPLHKQAGKKLPTCFMMRS